jgi:GH25 family lysozyme M1 (1,4-beta-N-acetylmuramidase)
LIPAEAITVPLSITGPTSSVVNHPEIKIFTPPFAYPVQGVDVSRYDGEINWSELAGKGGCDLPI